MYYVGDKGTTVLNITMIITISSSIIIIVIIHVRCHGIFNEVKVCCSFE